MTFPRLIRRRLAPGPLLKKLGPGLITGAADDDPSGIASYSQAGAQFGNGMLWSVLFTFPLMVGIQVVSARIGRVTGHGLAANMRLHYPRSLVYGLVLLLVAENKTNKQIAAELFISHRTVETHRSNLCQKLDLQGAHKLLQFAIEHRSDL